MRGNLIHDMQKDGATYLFGPWAKIKTAKAPTPGLMHNINKS